MTHTFVIAEFGSCHDNQWGRMVEGILAAKRAGADAFKAQFWSDPLLKAQCDHAGVEFMVTCYLPEDIPVIAPFVKRFKVASFEARDQEFLKAHEPYDKPIIVSTGMMGGSPENYTLVMAGNYLTLHCVSSYPTPLDQANLGAIRGEKWGAVGYSDHTHYVGTGGLAVAAGASILEVHFRLDDTDRQNPDFCTALDPFELKVYVDFVRRAEILLGDGVKKPQACEAEMSKYRVRT